MADCPRCAQQERLARLLYDRLREVSAQLHADETTARPPEPLCPGGCCYPVSACMCGRLRILSSPEEVETETRAAAMWPTIRRWVRERWAGRMRRPRI